MVDLNTQNLGRIVQQIKKFGVDSQVIDIKALWDKTLTYQENKKIILDQAKLLSPETKKKMEEKHQKDEQEALQREMVRKEEEHYRQVFSKRIEEIKSNKIAELTPYFKDYYKHIEVFLGNKVVNGMIVVGTGGIGKSFNLITKLQEKKLKFELMKGHMTPLSFFRQLYEHREKEFLIIDDVAKLINDMDIISLLLGACDYDNRKVEWISSSPLTADLPKEFIFNSKIFILANKLDKDNEFIGALKDRCVCLKLNFSDKQLVEMMYILAKRRNYPLEIVDYVRGFCEDKVIKNLSLRLLDKIFGYYDKGENWKKITEQLIEIDVVRTVVKQLMSSGLTVKEQLERGTENGFGRATYYRVKKALETGEEVDWGN